MLRLQFKGSTFYVRTQPTAKFRAKLMQRPPPSFPSWSVVIMDAYCLFCFVVCCGSCCCGRGHLRRRPQSARYVDAERLQPNHSEGPCNWWQPRRYITTIHTAKCTSRAGSGEAYSDVTLQVTWEANFYRMALIPGVGKATIPDLSLWHLILGIFLHGLAYRTPNVCLGFGGLFPAEKWETPSWQMGHFNVFYYYVCLYNYIYVL